MKRVRWAAIGWISFGLILLVALRWLSVLSTKLGPSSAAIPMAEVVCFFLGLVCVLIGAKQAVTGRHEQASSHTRAPGPGLKHIESPSAHFDRVGVVLVFALGFSVLGLLLSSLRLQLGALNLANNGWSPFIGLAFSLMTIISVIGIVVAMQRHRFFTRSHQRSDGET